MKSLYKKRIQKNKKICFRIIKWFKNDDGSVVELEKAYLNVYIMMYNGNKYVLRQLYYDPAGCGSLKKHFSGC